MLRSYRLLGVLLLCITLLPLPSTSALIPSPEAQSNSDAPSVLIIENVGQFDAGARFQVWGGAGTTWLAEDAIWISLVEPAEQDAGDPFDREFPDFQADEIETPRKGVALRLSFDGANPHPRLEPFGPSETVVSYFLGNDPDQWRPDVPVWTGVRYVDLYPGVDLEIGGTAGSWSWRMVARDVGTRHAVSLQNIRLRVEGADTIGLLAGDEGHSLRLTTSVGEVSLPLLQVVDAKGASLALPKGGAQVSGNSVTAPFARPALGTTALADASSLVYCTYLGGSGDEDVSAVAVDSAGLAYVTGQVDVASFPITPGAFDTIYNGREDAFVSALSADGAALIYCTFLGSATNDDGTAIAVDSASQAYVAGYTEAADFPTTEGAVDRDPGIGREGFVSMLSADGSSLVYSTLLGGSSNDSVNGIAIDATGRAYVTGRTISNDFPVTPGAYDTTYNEGGELIGDAFVSLLTAGGSSLIYSTYVGGSGSEHGYGIATNSAGMACITGKTSSADFPTTPGAYSRASISNADAFVSVLNANGSALVASTYLGGYQEDAGMSVALDAAGRAYVAGYTYSATFPKTTWAFDPTFNGSGAHRDAFVTVVDPLGSRLVYSTFLGGDGDDQAWDLALDDAGYVYVTGIAHSDNYPTTANAFDPNPRCIFLSVLNPGGWELTYSTYFGGSGWDFGRALALDAAGSLYITGFAGSSDLPTTEGAYDRTRNGTRDVFVAKLAVPTVAPTPTFTPAGTIPLASTPASVLPLVYRPPHSPTLTPTRTATRTPLPTRTPTITRTRAPTYTRTPTRTLTPSLTPVPSLTPTRTNTPRPWVTVVSEDFEGTFPGAWMLVDTTDWGLTFGKRTCKAASGMYGGWALGSGRLGDVLGCGSRYVDNLETWMVYGPFSLADATAANIQLDLWLNAEYRYDGVFVGASIGGTFGGNVWTGTGEGWRHRTLDLSNVYSLGNLMGKPQVWVAIAFISDNINNLPEGAYVDNIVVRKCVGGGCASSASIASELGEGRTYSLMDADSLLKPR